MPAKKKGKGRTERFTAQLPRGLPAKIRAAAAADANRGIGSWMALILTPACDESERVSRTRPMRQP